MTKPCSTLFDDPRWFLALRLDERLERLRSNGNELGVPAGSKRATRRFERWRTQEPFAQGPHWARRLALDGLSEETLFRLLEAPPENYHTPCTQPLGWLDEIRNAWTRAPFEKPLPLPGLDDHQSGFLISSPPYLPRCCPGRRSVSTTSGPTGCTMPRARSRSTG